MVQIIWEIQLDLRDIKCQTQNLPDSVNIYFFQFGNQMTSTIEKVISWLIISWLMVALKENALD